MTDTEMAKLTVPGALVIAFGDAGIVQYSDTMDQVVVWLVDRWKTVVFNPRYPGALKARIHG